ncbi:MAG TPA: YggT family protein [Acidimicrobiales bacterium]|nr:YggT family protein [Acidimicrobiales bacterium]
MSFWLHRPFYTLGILYIVIMAVWAVMSWFPIAPGSTASRVRSSLGALVQPVVAPFRKVIPPVGMFDVSFMVAFFAVLIITEFVLVLIVV